MPLTLTAYVNVLFVLLLCLFLSKHLFPFLLVPAGLVSIRFFGEVMQEEDIGPIWAQHHLGDVGIISNNMMWGVVAAMAVTLIKKDYLSAEPQSRSGTTRWSGFRSYRRTVARRIPAALLTVSLLIYGLAMLTEVGQSNLVEKGYSGAFDWSDSFAFTIGMVAMGLNYIVIGRKVRRKIVLQQAK